MLGPASCGLPPWLAGKKFKMMKCLAQAFFSRPFFLYFAYTNSVNSCRGQKLMNIQDSTVLEKGPLQFSATYGKFRSEITILDWQTVILHTQLRSGDTIITAHTTAFWGHHYHSIHNCVLGIPLSLHTRQKLPGVEHDPISFEAVCPSFNVGTGTGGLRRLLHQPQLHGQLWGCSVCTHQHTAL